MNKTDEVRVPVFLTYEEFAALLSGLQVIHTEADEALQRGDEHPDFWLREREKFERMLEEHYAVFQHYSRTGVWRGEEDE